MDRLRKSFVVAVLWQGHVCKISHKRFHPSRRTLNYSLDLLLDGCFFLCFVVLLCFNDARSVEVHEHAAFIVANHTKAVVALAEAVVANDAVLVYAVADAGVKREFRLG